MGPDGSIYVIDFRNFRIRRIGPNGIVTTVAGTGTEGFTGDGGPATSARIGYVYGLKVDVDGNLYFSDASNQRIRRVGVNGIIVTVAGNGGSGFSGDGGPAIAAGLSADGIDIEPNGQMYISDWSNMRIRRISSALSIGNTALSDRFVPSEDGNAVDHFDWLCHC